MRQNQQNDRVQTKRVNSIFSAIPLLTKDLDKIKSGEPVDFNQFSARVTPTGFKPVTAGAEIQCAIQLRHGAIFGVEQLHVLIVSCATGPFQRSLKQLKQNRTYQVKLLHVERIRGTKITLLPKLPT